MGRASAGAAGRRWAGVTASDTEERGGDVLVWLIAAMASPLRIEVLPDPPPPALARPGWDRPTPLPVGQGPVVVDGRFDEPAWAVAATSLRPLDVGPTPPGSTLRVALDPAGLAFALTGLPADQIATLVVDPVGLSQTWWRVVLDAAGASAWRCTLADQDVPAGWGVPEKAIPCARVEAFPVAGVGPDREVLLPWDRVGPASSRLKVHWVQTGPRHTGGTLAVTGSSVALPSAGRLLDVPQPPGRIAVETDVERGVWRLTVPGPARGQPETWAWSRWRAGRRVDGGEVAVPVGGATLELPDLAYDAVAVEVRRAGDGLAAAWTTGVRRRQNVMSLGTPVYREALELSYEIPDAAAVEVVVRDAAGELGRGTAELTAGAGRLRVWAEPGWGDVTVEVGHLWSGTAVRAR